MRASMSKTTLEYLSALPQLQALSKEQLEALANQAEFAPAAAGESFINEGDEAKAVFVLITGAAQVFKSNVMGQSTVLARIEPISMVGDQAFLQRNLGTRTASVRATEESQLIKIDGDLFRDLLNQNLEVNRSVSAIGNLQAEFNRFHLSPLVRAMSDQNLLDQCERRFFDTGSVVFSEGDTDSDVYLVSEGAVSIYQQVKQAQSKVAQIKSGESFGELAATEGSARAGTAICEEPTQLLVIPKDLFSNLLSSDASLASQMGALKKVYALSDGLMSTQHVGTFDGHPAVTTTFHLASGGVAVGTHVPSLESYQLSLPTHDDGHRALVYQGQHGRVALSLAADSSISKIQTEGQWSELPKVHGLALAGSPVEDWRLELFQQRGELFLDVGNSAVRESDVLCNCLQLSYRDVMASHTSTIEEGGAGSVCGGCWDRVCELKGESVWQLVDTEVIDRGDPEHRVLRFTPTFSDTESYRPGQHITVQVLVGDQFVERSYTLTSKSGDPYYEIIVKREPKGQLSRRFFAPDADRHVIRVGAPKGSYFWQTETQNNVLALVAGIGVTPAIAMGRWLGQSESDQHHLSVHLSVRDAEGLGFLPELSALEAVDQITLKVRESRQQGRIDKHAIASLTADKTWDAVFLCGPSTYVKTVRALLVDAGVSNDCIFDEDFAHAGAPVEQAEPASCPHQAGVQTPNLVILDANNDHTMLEQAHAFLTQAYVELDAADYFPARWKDVERAIQETGRYEHTTEELAYGAKLCWRNSSRCVGRQFWQGLNVRDYRHLTTPESMTQALFEHIEEATNSGNIQATMTVFAPDSPNKTGPRVWNSQLLRYAGYDDHGLVLGDPANVELTDIAIANGWQPPQERSGFDLLPLMIKTPEHPLYVQEIPAHLVQEVPITHPDYRWFESLELKWYGLPAVSEMTMSLGGIHYGAIPFNGWYMETEIGSRNFTDRTRYDLTKTVASRLGLDTSNDRSLWRDRAQLELNRAVLHSFDRYGVTIMDHHEASDSFMQFTNIEKECARDVWAEWSWVVPPTGGSLTDVFHVEWKDKQLLPNFFYRDKPWTQ